MCCQNCVFVLKVSDFGTISIQRSPAKPIFKHKIKNIILPDKWLFLSFSWVIWWLKCLEFSLAVPNCTLNVKHTLLSGLYCIRKIKRSSTISYLNVKFLFSCFTPMLSTCRYILFFSKAIYLENEHKEYLFTQCNMIMFPNWNWFPRWLFLE